MQICKDRARRFMLSGWGGVLILGIAAACRGWIYTPLAIPEGYRIPAMERFLPPEIWAALFLMAALMSAVCLFSQRGLAIIVGIHAALHTGMGCIYFGAWITGDSVRGYATAITYFVVAALIMWAYARGSATEVRIRHDTSGEGPA